MMPKIMGSVGRLNPKRISKSWRLMARGVHNTVRRNSLSKENNESATTKNTAGNNENQKNSLAIKMLLSIMYKALKPYVHFNCADRINLLQ